MLGLKDFSFARYCRFVLQSVVLVDIPTSCVPFFTLDLVRFLIFQPDGGQRQVIVAFLPGF